MQKILLLKSVTVVFLTVGILLSFGFSNKSNDNIFPYKIYQYDMPNGLKVVSVPYDSPGIAAFYIVVRTGSRNEVEPGVTGFAHFFEHMMFRGTDRYPKDKYEQVLKSTGASANANTSLDRTIYHIVGNVDKLEMLFDVESDRFQNLHYSEHDFKTEAGAVKGEYTKNITNPLAQLYEDVQNAAFTTHTYKHTTMGFYKDILDMPNQYQYSLKFYDRFYRPEYCTVVVVGDITPEKVNALADKYFGNWKKGNYAPEIPVEPVQTETKFAHVKNADSPPYISLNFKGPAYTDATNETAVLDVLATLAFSRRSDIYKKLVLTEKKVRSINCSPSSSRDPNLISISAQLKDKADMQYVKDEIMRVINEIKNNAFNVNLIKEAVSNEKYGFAMYMDTPGVIANSLATYIYLTGDPESINKSYAQYDNVSPDDIIKIAKKYFIESGLTIGTVSADDNPNLK